MSMARRVYGWLMAAVLALPPAIKAMELLDALRPARKEHAVRLEMPDEGQHGHMPTVIPPPPVEPPFIPNHAMLDAANRAASMWGELKYHPAYYQSASHFPFS